jgi:hypothetical protein
MNTGLIKVHVPSSTAPSSQVLIYLSVHAAQGLVFVIEGDNDTQIGGILFPSARIQNAKYL